MDELTITCNYPDGAGAFVETTLTLPRNQVTNAPAGIHIMEIIDPAVGSFAFHFVPWSEVRHIVSDTEFGSWLLA